MKVWRLYLILVLALAGWFVFEVSRYVVRTRKAEASALETANDALAQCQAERDSTEEMRNMAVAAFDECTTDERAERIRLLRKLWEYDKVKVHCTEPDDCWEMR